MASNCPWLGCLLWWLNWAAALPGLWIPSSTPNSLLVTEVLEVILCIPVRAKRRLPDHMTPPDLCRPTSAVTEAKPGKRPPTLLVCFMPTGHTPVMILPAVAAGPHLAHRNPKRLLSLIPTWHRAKDRHEDRPQASDPRSDFLGSCYSSRSPQGEVTPLVMMCLGRVSRTDLDGRVAGRYSSQTDSPLSASDASHLAPVGPGDRSWETATGGDL